MVSAIESVGGANINRHEASPQTFQPYGPALQYSKEHCTILYSKIVRVVHLVFP